MAPWQGPRHRSWASNTVVSTVAIAIIFVTNVVWEAVGDSPQWLTALLGTCGGIWFGAIAQDSRKRAEEVEAKADQAQAKADELERRANRLTEVAEREHPDTAREAGADDA